MPDWPPRWEKTNFELFSNVVKQVFDIFFQSKVTLRRKGEIQLWKCHNFDMIYFSWEERQSERLRDFHDLNENILSGSKSAFLYGDLDRDQWCKICLDHGASKEPTNPSLWPWIDWFLWFTMIQTDLISLILILINPKERTLILENISAPVSYLHF